MKYKQDVERSFAGLKKQGQDTCVKADNKTKVNNAIDSDGKIELKRTGGTCPICTDKQGVISSKNLTTTSAKLHDGCKCQLVPLLSKKQRIERASELIIPDNNDITAIRKELAKAEELQLIDYEKKLSEFKKSDERDLIAHLCLIKNGEKVVVLKEDAPEGFSNIDLKMNEKLWEVKSPVGNSERTIQHSFEKTRKQFSKTHGVLSQKPRIIINLTYTDLDVSNLNRNVEKMLRKYNFAEVKIIFKNHSIITIKNG